VAVQPQPRSGGLVVSRRHIFFAIALAIFIIAAFIHIGDASFKYEQTMEWAGFASFAAAFL